MDLKKYLNEWPQRQSLLEMSQPAGWWRDGFPLGNGSLGAMPYGRICEERILINHERIGPQEIPEGHADGCLVPAVDRIGELVGATFGGDESQGPV